MRHDASATLGALKSTLDDHRPLAPDLFRSLRKDIVLRHIYHSNAIEGNALTLRRNPQRHHFEVIIHADAITYLVSLIK